MGIEYIFGSNVQQATKFNCDRWRYCNKGGNQGSVP